jgi:CheY-like chemotaxis protein
MPTLTGWEFLEVFKTLPEPIKNQFNIYMLSSSIDKQDILCAKENPLVIDFIEKPLSNLILTKIFG